MRWRKLRRFGSFSPLLFFIRFLGNVKGTVAGVIGLFFGVSRIEFWLHV